MDHPPHGFKANFTTRPTGGVLWRGTEILAAKNERGAALDKLDEMIEAADAVMVARGDLGLEIPLEEIVLAQKEIIPHAVAARKPVVKARECSRRWTRQG